MTTVDWERVAAELAPIRTDLAGTVLRQKSRDYFWFSPVLAAQLGDCRADIVVSPADEDELRRLLAYCFARRIAVTPRGAGTGNYGQAVPLHGGVLLDLTRLGDFALVRPGVVRAGPGANLATVDTRMRDLGWQLRLYPSTVKLATIGGFVAGGATGVGAINFGTLDSPGNVVALRVVTMENEPRAIELRGDAVRQAVHAYGLTGIITAVEMALTPAVRWHERVVGVDGFPAALRLGDAVCRSGGLHLNEVAVVDASTAAFFRGLGDHLVAGEALLLVQVAESSVESFDAFVAQRGGTQRFARGAGVAHGAVPPIHEYCWNHTTLRAIVQDKSITYLQCLFGGADPAAQVAALIERFGDEVPMHIEFGRLDGDIAWMGIPLVRYTTPERLDEILAAFRDAGCAVLNPHTYALEGADPAVLACKQSTDPAGLLNPGKMPGWPNQSSEVPR